MNTAQKPSFGLWDLLSHPTVQSVLGVLILLTVCAIAVYVLSKLRDSNTQDVPMDELLRKNFEEMRSGGDINEAEFRNIASLLAEQPRRSSQPTPKTSSKTDSSKSE
jgi:hypothetical protein